MELLKLNYPIGSRCNILKIFLIKKSHVFQCLLNIYLISKVKETKEKIEI